ncbi:patatin-like phospholipase family protein [Chitinophaga sp. Ak27]|uniref:patatin-like phospholipase family protein n=1 Tax=Chitinophaga sp. Ak27 TaxID=2726116 RepID=UPI00145E45C8|nr:patatin-like phospholipase family protein [Chitinophaga sp. Ak27]NLU91360.1 hypothetical protein [Chitinophaga sp. Ak27]
MKKKKRALVLAGGGAKGAYAFGCMQAFKEAGIEFDVVAGTSVGALNAFLWSADAMEKGEDLWNNLSFSTIYPVKILNSKFYPGFVIKIVSLLYVVFRLHWATVLRQEVPFRKVWIMVLSSLCALLPFLIMYAHFNDTFSHILMAIGIGFVIPFLCVLDTFLLDDDGKRGRGMGLYMSSILVVICCCYQQQILNIWPNHRLFTCMLYLAASMIGMAIFYGLTVLLKRVINAFWVEGSSILESGPLKAKLQEIIAESKLQVPIWATVARNVSVYDPDKPSWSVTVMAQNPPKRDYGIWNPIVSQKWCPKYIKLNELDSEKAVSYCAASAAIPFGIVPSITIDKVEYVDGGIVDNCPVVPILRYEEVDEIFVVMLTVFECDTKAVTGCKITTDDSAYLSRLFDLSEYPVPKGNKRAHELPDMRANYPPTVLPLQSLHTDARFVLFYPKKHLGGWFSGTLKFSKKYSKETMKQGKKDAQEKLADLGGL